MRCLGKSREKGRRGRLRGGGMVHDDVVVVVVVIVVVVVVVAITQFVEVRER